MTTDTPIDVVYTWVDGDDPVLKAKRRQYSRGGKEFKYEDVASDVRYTDDGELKYSVASVLKFAPWVRNIFIVTDGQTPDIDGFINRYFPRYTAQIKIVDHKEICRGYEKYLPVFNSMSIETMLWRIEGLSENYIYLNDDVFFVHDIQPSDFFDDGKIVAYLRKYKVDKIRRRRFWYSLLPGHKEMRWEYFMLNAAVLAGVKEKFPRIVHSPHPQKKSLFEAFYATHEAAMIKNLDCRFREGHQYNPQVLNYILAEQQDKLIRRSPGGYTLHATPKPERGKNYFEERLKEISQNPDALFCCMNSLSKGTEKEIRLAFEWLAKRLEL